MLVICARIAHHDALIADITVSMQFTFNPEASPWQPGAPVKPSWPGDGKKHATPQRLTSAKSNKGQAVPSLETGENAFPALGGVRKSVVSDSVTSANATPHGDANKAVAVAPVKGFTWASIVTDKSNGIEASVAPAPSPAPTQPSLLTAALAGSPVSQPEVWTLLRLLTCPYQPRPFASGPGGLLMLETLSSQAWSVQPKPSQDADVPSTAAPQDTENDIDNTNGSILERQERSAKASCAAEVEHTHQPSTGQKSTVSSSHAHSSLAQDGTDIKPVSHVSVPVSKASRNTHSSAEEGLSKGTFRGSPVTELRLATDVNRNTVRALRAMGPSDFQAVREIGQGAFGKVRLTAACLPVQDTWFFLHTRLCCCPGRLAGVSPPM